MANEIDPRLIRAINEITRKGDWSVLTVRGLSGERYDEVLGNDGQIYQIHFAPWKPGMPGYIQVGTVWVVVAFDRSGQICPDLVYRLGPRGWRAMTEVARHIGRMMGVKPGRSMTIPSHKGAVDFVLCAKALDHLPVALQGHMTPHPEDHYPPLSSQGFAKGQVAANAA